MWRPRNFDALRSARFCHHVTDRAATSPATSMQMTANELSLSCEKCGGTAATIRLIEGPWGKHSLAVTGFIGEMTIAAIGDRPVDLGMFQQIVRLSQGDLKQLHQLDRDIFGFICRICGSAYCTNCWQNIHAKFDLEWPVWFEEYRGRCPLGHEQMLQD